MLQAWCERKGYNNGPMLTEDKMCLFLNTEVVGRESRARGWVREKAEREKAKVEKLAAKEAEEGPAGPIKRPKKRAKSRHPRPTPLVNPPAEQDNLPASRPRDPDDPDIEEYDTDPEIDDEEAEEAFIRTIGASTVEQYVSSLIELWGAQYRDQENSHLFNRGRQLKDLFDVVRRSDWERKKLEYIDRGLFTLSDGYDTEKMVEALKWCWEAGSKAKNGPEPYLRTAANFLMSE